MALKNIGCNFEVVEISEVDKIRILSIINLDKLFDRCYNNNS